MNLKTFLILSLLITVSFSFAQSITYKSRGRVFDSENKKLSSEEVRELLANKPELLSNYNAGRSKKTIGNILLGAGIGFVVGDLVKGVFADVVYPTAFTYVGFAAITIAIPIKIGYAKKIKTSVEEYNKQVATNYSRIKIENASLYANQNGLGIRVSF